MNAHDSAPLAADALDALIDARAVQPAAVGAAPHRPGLYAVHGAPSVWIELGLGEAADARPLYVGKAEDSLASRDVKTHFGTGHTANSTLRRSLAGLLRDALDLHGRPRNIANPGHFSSFGLEPQGDERLTAWMLDRLRLATWAPAEPVVLDTVETALIAHWVPPLNLSKVATPWRPKVRAGRQVLAAEAAAWLPPRT